MEIYDEFRQRHVNLKLDGAWSQVFDERVDKPVTYPAWHN